MGHLAGFAHLPARRIIPRSTRESREAQGKGRRVRERGGGIGKHENDEGCAPFCVFCRIAAQFFQFSRGIWPSRSPCKLHTCIRRSIERGSSLASATLTVFSSKHSNAVCPLASTILAARHRRVIRRVTHTSLLCKRARCACMRSHVSIYIVYLY